jgi:hypothetical protein
MHALQFASPGAQFDVIESPSNWTVKAALIGTPSSACAVPGLRAKCMVARASRIKEIEKTFLFETRFRDIVIFSLDRF